MRTCTEIPTNVMNSNTADLGSPHSADSLGRNASGCRDFLLKTLSEVKHHLTRYILSLPRKVINKEKDPQQDCIARNSLLLTVSYQVHFCPHCSYIVPDKRPVKEASDIDKAKFAM